MKRFLPFAVMMVAAACSDGAAPFAPTAESESVLMASRIAAANEGKVYVCHIDGKDNYRLISVSASALGGHMRHDDKLPGEDELGRPDCSVPFEFEFTDPPFVRVEGEDGIYYQIAWTVEGLPSGAYFDVNISEYGKWRTVGSGILTESGSYLSPLLDQSGDYEIVPKLSGGGSLGTAKSIYLPGW